MGARSKTPKRIKATVITPEEVFQEAVLTFSEKIEAIEPAGYEANYMDIGPVTIVPGFIDIHVHGGGGVDFTAARAPEEFKKVVDVHIKGGTTTLLATAVTAPYAEYRKLVEAIKNLPPEIKKYYAGVNLEGPHINPEKAGAQPKQFIKNPSIEEMKNLLRFADGYIKIQTIAPEIHGAVEYIKFLRKNGVIPSLGHTNASFEEFIEGVKAGAKLTTHLFNAHSPFHHRKPGSAFAGLLSSIFVELIYDGHHVSEELLPLVYKMKKDKLIFITDAISATGLPDGEYPLGAYTVQVKNGRAYLPDGTIAGSTLLMKDAFERALKLSQRKGWSIPITDIVSFLTKNPASLLGLKTGELKPGSPSDFLIFRGDLTKIYDDLELIAVFKDGEQVYGEQIE